MASRLSSELYCNLSVNVTMMSLVCSSQCMDVTICYNRTIIQARFVGSYRKQDLCFKITASFESNVATTVKKEQRKHAETIKFLK